jgi:hypothetical protein
LQACDLQFEQERTEKTKIGRKIQTTKKGINKARSVQTIAAGRHSRIPIRPASRCFLSALGALCGSQPTRLYTKVAKSTKRFYLLSAGLSLRGLCDLRGKNPACLSAFSRRTLRSQRFKPLSYLTAEFAEAAEIRNFAVFAIVV